jgi:tetratricopeptide (TPR) repeat protein
MRPRSLTLILLAAFAAATAHAAEPGLVGLVKKIQPAVATIVGYDIDRNVASLGTGFFVNSQGHLVTNYHVMQGRYAADVRTAAGRSYPVAAVLAEDREADLVRLRVDIPPGEVAWIPLSDRVPEIAEQVVVVGSPMGLEQTVTEGIVSSVREIPPVGTVFQMSAPISQGSSGSPVVDMKGQVVGIATFQFVQGQNLNFAVAARQVLALKRLETARTVSEWTFGNLGQKPKLAEALCRKGFSFSIQGEDRKAIDYFRRATEEDPQDPAAWSGLGSCYAGLDHPEEAVTAYRLAVEAAPRDPAAHFHLANYFVRIGRTEEAIAAYAQAIAINPQFEAAHFNLGLLLVREDRLEEGRRQFEAVTRLNPEAAPAFFNAGIASARMGRFEESLSALREVVRLQPEFAPGWFAIGEAFGGLGRTREKLGAYREAIRVDPDYAPAHHAMGAAHAAAGHTGPALEEYKILRHLDAELAQNLFKQIYADDPPVRKPKGTAKRSKP